METTTIIIIALAVGWVVSAVSYLIASSRLATAKLDAQEDMYHIVYNLQDTIEGLDDDLNDLISSIPAGSFKVINKKMAKHGQELVRVKDLDGKLTSVMQDIEGITE